MQKIAITTGDLDGIGLEITLKALFKLGPQKNIVFFLFRSSHSNSFDFKKIDKKFERIVVDDIDQALNFFSILSNKRHLTDKILFDIDSEKSPAEWVQSAAKKCIDNKLDSMVTGPISKSAILNSGFKDLGHTDILKRISQTKSVNMGFVGRHFNVVLATGHIPLSKVSKAVSLKNLSIALTNANLLRLALRSKKPIAFLGLNPHAGEGGIIGDDELHFSSKLLKIAKIKKIPLVGPLVPDAAFFKENHSKYSVFLCLYHDQGLIPFKAIHGQDSGVHISLGLPFIRTSVDHGTAKDIFGKNIANPNSMIDAIQWAIKFTRLKK